jgi:hypothetical protein
MGFLDWLWFASGVAVTAVVVIAVGYWIVQEMRARAAPLGHDDERKPAGPEIPPA